MDASQEGQIILKEKYGSTSQERLYVKPPAQAGIVTLDDDKPNSVAGWFNEIFLPQGYPDSVSKDYLAYQIWDTAQAFCSTITGTLATQEVLKGVGVGDSNSTPLAATIIWVIKDGCGHIGRIMFAYSHGTSLDAYSKKWRLYADILNDAAMCIEISLPLFKNYTTFVLCVTTVMKAIVGVAGGATRAALTQHHALRGNMADVAAKDSAQETAVNLTASIVALIIITICGSSLTLFILMMILHVVFNYFAVRAVCLKTFNETRFLQVIDSYLREEVISNPCQINKTEPIIFYQLGSNLLDLKICGFRIHIGQSIKNIISQEEKADTFTRYVDLYNETNYILIPNIDTRQMYVLIRDNASSDDILCAYFHAVLLSIIICAINDYSLPVYDDSADYRPYAQICRTLQSAEWSRYGTHSATETLSGFIFEPSEELITYVAKIVRKEWLQVQCGLLQVGWNLDKHVLVVDEWRICDNLLARQLPAKNSRRNQNALNVASRIFTFGDAIDDDIDNEEIDEINFTIEPESVGTISKLPEMNKSTKSKLEQTETRESDIKSNTKLQLNSPDTVKEDNKSSINIDSPTK